MNVILPTAGLGTRLRPHTYSKPKPLISVAGKPVLGHILDRLTDLRLDKLVFIVGYLGEQIEAYVRKEYDLPVEFVVQHELKGQADAVLLARGLVSGPTLILFVDTLVEADLGKLNHVDADGVMYVKEVDDPRRFGVAQVENGRITRLIEKPATMENKLAVVGLYYLREIEQLFSATEELMERNIQTKGEFYLADALQLMIDRGARIIPEQVAVWEDCGKPETVLETNRYLLDKGLTHEVPTENAILIPPVHIHDGATIQNSVIGPYVSIGAGSVIRNSIIRNSIINGDAELETVTLEESLIGDDAEVNGDFHRLNVGDSSQVCLG
jgi:glucose-1-phosphate thymidylyltransferase